MTIAVPHDLFELEPNPADPFHPVKTFKATYPNFIAANEAAALQPQKSWSVEIHQTT